MTLEFWPRDYLNPKPKPPKPRRPRRPKLPIRAGKAHQKLTQAISAATTNWPRGSTSL